MPVLPSLIIGGAGGFPGGTALAFPDAEMACLSSARTSVVLPRAAATLAVVLKNLRRCMLSMAAAPYQNRELATI
jgi:hypothetical protein